MDSIVIVPAFLMPEAQTSEEEADRRLRHASREAVMRDLNREMDRAGAGSARFAFLTGVLRAVRGV